MFVHLISSSLFDTLHDEDCTDIQTEGVTMMIQIAKQIIVNCSDNKEPWENHLLKIIQYHNPSFLTILPLTSTVLFTVSSDGIMTCLFHPA